jgi:ABC-type glutathione transport system ATPase component
MSISQRESNDAPDTLSPSADGSLKHAPPQKPLKHPTDEATSALDAATEREILDALALLSKGRTSIFVAHRLSTAAQCDQIVVLGPGGKVSEVGSHSELLAKPGGAYAALWAHQSGGVDELAAAVQERNEAAARAA